MINFARTASLKVEKGGHERTCAERLLISTSIMQSIRCRVFLQFPLLLFLIVLLSECSSLEL